MPAICQTVFIGAPAEKVYQALTTQEGLSAWWTPETTARAEVGSIARFGFGSGYFKEMEIDSLRPPGLVVWRCISGAEEWIGTSLTFTLHAGDRRALLEAHPEAADQLQQGADSGTLLTLAHQDWKDYSPMFAECSYTWGRFLSSLKQLCETGKGRPWPTQHGNG